MAVLLALAGCATHLTPQGPAVTQASVAADAFVMPDGTRLPYRTWAPAGPARAVLLALHGMNDSRDAFEVSGPVLAEAGILVVAPDQRGFGATATRGFWPGVPTLVADARTMAGLLAAAHPGVPVYGLGESMGAAVLATLAGSNDPGALAGIVLAAPAVRGRAALGPLLSAGLWLAYETVPGLTLTRPSGVKIVATDNSEALRRLSTDPLTIGATRVDATKGLVDLMDAAVAAAPNLRRPALVLIGGRDDLVPGAPSDAFAALLPPGARDVRHYPDGYHLVLRDLERAPRLAAVVAWLGDGRRGAGLRGGAGVFETAKDP